MGDYILKSHGQSIGGIIEAADDWLMHLNLFKTTFFNTEHLQTDLKSQSVHDGTVKMATQGAIFFPGKVSMVVFIPTTHTCRIRPN